VAVAAALAQLVDVVAGFPTASVNGADWSTLAVGTLPAVGIATGLAAVAIAAHRRSPIVPVLAVVVAVTTTTAGLSATAATTPGPLTCMLAVAAALLALITGRWTGSRAAAEGPLVGAWSAGCAAAGLYALVVSHEVDGGTAGQVVAGVLFLGLAVAGAVCGSQLSAGSVTVRWALAGLWVLDAIAVSLADAGGHLLWPLLALHLGLAVVLVWPLVAGDEAARVIGRAAAWVSGAPRVGVLAGAGGIVLLVGVVVAFGGAAASSGSVSSGWATSGSAIAGSTVTVGAVGVLALAAACTPTMTPRWRIGLVLGAGVAFWTAWHSVHAMDDGGSTFAWTVFFPVVLVGVSGWGWWTNRRTGATATRPGWEGPGSLPPMISVPFVPPPTAKARSQVRLEVSSTLGPDDLLDAVRRATAVRGNWFRVYGDTVTVAAQSPGGLGLAIGGTCTFRARASSSGSGSVLHVGGMDTWTKSRWYVDFVIPISPAKVEGFRMYKLFLTTVASEVARSDGSSQARIGRPGR
jgi:hypothetical protein